MIQFLKLIDGQNIAYPPEIVGNEKIAKQMWGVGNYVQRDIQPNEDPATFADKLVAGKVVESNSRKQEAEDFNTEIRNKRRDDAKTFRRTAAIKELKKDIDSTKTYDQLTPLERKLIFGIDGGATDEELGVE